MDETWSNMAHHKMDKLLSFNYEKNMRRKRKRSRQGKRGEEEKAGDRSRQGYTDGKSKLKRGKGKREERYRRKR